MAMSSQFFHVVRAPAPSIRPLALAVSLALLPSAAFAQSQSTPAATAKGEQVLAPVVISAAGFQQDIKEAPASITVITREELQEKRVGSLTQALEDVEGIDVGASAGKTGGLNISIRGMPSDYTLVLIDGRRQNAAGSITPNGFGETSTSFIPPVSAIERIEIIRGPMATLYGSDAMGGVINIITRKVSKTWGGSVTLDGTLQGNDDFGNTRKLEIYTSGPLVENMLGLSVRGSLFQRDAASLTSTGANAGATISTRGPSPVKADITTIGTRLTLTPTKGHDIWFDYDRGDQTYDNSKAQLGTLGAQGYEPEMRFNQEQMTLAHTGRFAFGVLDTSLMRATRETIGRTTPAGTPGKVTGSPRALEATNTILDSKLVTPVGDQHVLSIGAQWWDAEMIDGVAPAPYTYTQYSLYGENEWRARQNLAITLGLRHDDHSTFGGHTSPRLYGVWSATERVTLKGGVSRGYKTPRLEQLADGITGFTGQGTRPTIGTPTLKPETSTTAEIGAYFDNLAGFTASVSVFNNDFKDKIASSPTGLLNCSWAANPNRAGCVDYGNFPAVDTFGQSVNIDKAVTRGIELATRIPLARAWTLSANYTYTDSEQKTGANAGRPLGDTPEHMINSQLRWKIDERFATWLRHEYRSERYRGEGAARTALGDYKAFHLFHLGGSYQATQNVTITAAIYNLLDKDFLEYGAFPSTPTASNPSGVSYTGRYANPQEGRRLWVSANMAF